MHFSCDEVYDRMGIRWEKSTHTVGKDMSTNFRGSPYTMGFVAFFLCYWKLMGKPMHFSCDEVYYIIRIRLAKKTHTAGKNMTTNFQGFRCAMGFVAFSPCYRKLMGEAMHFPYNEI